MTRIIIVNGTELFAFHWYESSLVISGDDPPLPMHVRDRELLEHGVSDLRPGEVRFDCDLSIAFDTTFEVKGEGRKFVILSRDGMCHIAKPY